MGRVLLVLGLIAVAILIAFGGCDVQILGSNGFADQLEETGLAGIPVKDVRCDENIEGWHYVCSYERDGQYRSMGFIVSEWDDILATSDEFPMNAALPPAPGQNVPWSP